MALYVDLFLEITYRIWCGCRVDCDPNLRIFLDGLRMNSLRTIALTSSGLGHSFTCKYTQQMLNSRENWAIIASFWIYWFVVRLVLIYSLQWYTYKSTHGDEHEWVTNSNWRWPVAEPLTTLPLTTKNVIGFLTLVCLVWLIEVCKMCYWN